MVKSKYSALSLGHPSLTIFSLSILLACSIAAPVQADEEQVGVSDQQYTSYQINNLSYPISARKYLLAQHDAMRMFFIAESGIKRKHVESDALHLALNEMSYIIENAWVRDYRQGHLAVPDGYGNTDQAIRQGRAILLAGYSEYRKYFESGETEHLKRGRRLFEQAESEIQIAGRQIQAENSSFRIASGQK